MKPTPSLSARLRFSTKDVGKGFYRGNRTGAMGAHTRKGGYLIDYRKVRNYNVPDLTGFKLTPYVTKEVGEIETPERTYNWEEQYPDAKGIVAEDLSLMRRTRAIQLLKEWRENNPNQYNDYLRHQVDKLLPDDIKRFKSGEKLAFLEKFLEAKQKTAVEDGY